MSQSECKGKLYDDRPCLRKVISGSDWCIFHYPNKNGDLIKNFDSILTKEIEEQRADHPNFLDFTEFDFPNYVRFDFNLPHVYFGRAVFRNDVSFVKGSESFFSYDNPEIGIIFEGKAWFYGATFEKEANFFFASFKKEAVFSFTTYKETVFFQNITFEGSVRFTGAKFNKSAWFGGSIFRGLSRLMQLEIAGNFYLRDVQIENRLFIDVKKWLNKSENSSPLISCLVIRDPIFGKFGRLIIRDKIGIINKKIVAGISFLRTELDQVEFIGEEWPNSDNDKRKIIIDEIILSINGYVNYEGTPKVEEIAQTYRRLRSNFEKAKRYSEAGDFYIGEMEILRKHDPSFLNRRLFDLYQMLARYGESPIWPLIWGLVSIIILTEIRCFSSLNDQKPIQGQFVNSFYLTLKAFMPFTTVNSLFDILTKLIGTLLIGLMFIALRRKLERR